MSSIPTRPRAVSSIEEGPTTSKIVRVTITETGTAVYTEFATSYSYIPSYSTVLPDITPSPDNTNGIQGSSSGTNTGAIVGGVVGGVGGVALIGIVFFLYRRFQKKKNSQKNSAVSDTNYYDDMNQPQNAHRNMESLNPTPRTLVAPLGDINSGEGANTNYYYNNGYYEDIGSPYPQPFYPVNDDLNKSDIATPNTTDGMPYSTGFRQVPNQIDSNTVQENYVGYGGYPIQDGTADSSGSVEGDGHVYTNYINQERHVPHSKDDVVTEPPHTKD